MAKIILSFAIAVFAVMTVFASAAEACVSCEYVPSVANSPSKPSKAKRYKKKRKARPAKKVETAKTAPIKSETGNENSTISTATLDNDETVEADVEAKDEPATTTIRDVGCKKYFPTVDQTLTVPCE